MSLGERISRLRTQRRMTQEALADALDVSRQSVSKWETDASVPDLDKLVRLSDVFGVTLDELVRGEQREQAPCASAPGPVCVASGETEEISRGRLVLGTTLLTASLAGMLILLLLAGLGGLVFGLSFLCPMFLCGCICVGRSLRPGLWCGWTVYLFWEFWQSWLGGVELVWSELLQTLTQAPGGWRMSILWSMALGRGVLLVWTFFSFQGFRLEPEGRRTVRLALGWAVLLLLMVAPAAFPPLAALGRLGHSILSTVRFILAAGLITATAAAVRGRKQG